MTRYQTSKPVSHVVTASHLLEGDVIYRMQTGRWCRDLAEAELLPDPATAATALQTAEREGDPILGAYLAAVHTDASGTVHPVHFRETFRATGPSNRFLGKQAELAQKGTDHVRL